MTDLTDLQKSVLSVIMRRSRDSALVYAKRLAEGLTNVDTLTTVMTGFYLAASTAATAKIGGPGKETIELLGIEATVPSKEEAREMLVSLLEQIIDEVYLAQAHLETENKRSGI